MAVDTIRIGEVKVRIDKFQVHLEKQFIGLCASWDEWGKREGWIKYHTQNPDLLGGLMLESRTDTWSWEIINSVCEMWHLECEECGAVLNIKGGV